MSELLGIARFRFHEGKREEYLRLSDQAMEIVRTTEPGTLQYDLYLNEDQSECVFIERYRDSEAAMEHAANLGHLFPVSLATSSGRGWLAATCRLSSLPTGQCPSTNDDPSANEDPVRKGPGAEVEGPRRSGGLLCCRIR
jgi:quinol monooxygenase YgiN